MADLSMLPAWLIDNDHKARARTARRAGARKSWSEVPVVRTAMRGPRRGGLPRSAWRRRRPSHGAQPDQPGHPVAVALVWPQETRACPRRRCDHARLAQSQRCWTGGSRDGDRVRVPGRALPGLSGGPHADAGEAAEFPVGLGVGSVQQALQAVRHARGRMIVCARTPSTPAWCQSQDGSAARRPARGRPACPAGPGRAEESRTFDSRIFQARCASRMTTFCSRIAGTSASISRPLRPIRRPGRGGPRRG